MLMAPNKVEGLKAEGGSSRRTRDSYRSLPHRCGKFPTYGGDISIGIAGTDSSGMICLIGGGGFSTQAWRVTRPF